MNRQIILTIIAPILLFWVGPALASSTNLGESIAIVVAVRGGVTAENNSQQRKLSIKNPIYKSDIISTGKHGRIQLLFNDTTIISLARNTTMSVADYSWDSTTKKGSMKTKIKEGTFRIMGGALTRFSPKHFTTETPTATIGIRGSMYAGTVTAGSLSVVFQGGKGIDIMNAAGAVAITRPGFGTHVLNINQPPLPPKKFSASDMAVINNALNGPPEPEEKIQAGEDKKGAAEKDGRGTEASEQTQPDGKGDGNGADTQAKAQANEPAGTDVSGNEAVGESTGGGDTAGEATPPPLGAIDQFGSGTLQPIVDPNINNIVTSTTVDSAQGSTSTGSIGVSSSLPGDGISQYSGTLTGSGGGNIINANTFMAVNWRNGKVLGVINDSSTGSNLLPAPPTFFFGDVIGTGVGNIKILGSDLNYGSGSVVTHEVTGAAGNFYGSSYQFFDFSAIGNDYDIRTQSQITGAGSWNVAATIARVSGLPQGSVPTGPALWKGFVVGVAENMNNPSLNRKRFMNTLFSNFYLNIDKTNGVMTGSISADSLEDTDSVDNNIIGLSVGGGLGSVYVRDDIVGAVIGCTGNCIDTDANGTADVPTDPHGSYMITAGPTEQMSPYFTWGYWETAFNDGSNEYHAHVPGTMWLAGPRTADINPGYITPSFKGTYNGSARGIEIPSAGGMKDLGKGTCHLDVDLSTTAKVTGYIDFPNVVNLSLGGTGSIVGSNAGFTTGITNMSGGTLNAAFFGATANAVGGNFEAYNSGNGSQYMGIFGANR